MLSGGRKVNFDLRYEDNKYVLFVEDGDKFDIIQYISAKYRQNPEAYRGVVIEVIPGLNVDITEEDKRFIKARVRAATKGGVIVEFKDGPDYPPRPYQSPSVIKILPGETAKKVPKNANLLTMPISAPKQREKVGFPARVVIGPVRSGVKVVAESPVVVIGDVHYGAEVKASDAVIVVGRVSGRITVDGEAIVVGSSADGAIGILGEFTGEISSPDWFIAYPGSSGIIVENGDFPYIVGRLRKWMGE